MNRAVFDADQNGNVGRNGRVLTRDASSSQVLASTEEAVKVNAVFALPERWMRRLSL